MRGSVAAPTAGLHFTPELLASIQALGVEMAFVTLHIGWGTFKPVEVEDATTHEMHAEYWEIAPEAADAINRAKLEGRRVVVVGTTAVRLLEHVARATEASGQHPGSVVRPGSGWADIFIYPGYRFRVVDALVTNFHLPKSTLLMLVSAFAGKDLVFRAYDEAIKQRYRFYSFGDAMMML